MRLAILGATGVYARHLIPRLGGYRVRALVRRPETASVARACDAEVRTADIFDEESLVDALAECDVAINLATALGGGDFAANDRLRREGTPTFVRACVRAKVPRVIQQGIAMVNGAGEDWADETMLASAGDPMVASAYAAALEMEACVRASGLEVVILRGGLFYGPGTGLDDDWFARARAGKLRVPGDGDRYVSLVHIADMAEATVAAIRRWPGSTTLAVCEDAPARWREVFAYVARLAGTEPPARGAPVRFPSFRVRNQRAREALGWAPRCADHRSGLAR